jgi:hypothetical protein
MHNSQNAYMPLPPSYEPEANTSTATDAQQLEYQLIIGSLLCIMLGMIYSTVINCYTLC